MSSLETSGIILACVFGGVILGMVLRTILPKQHLSSESKDVVKMGMGLIGTMTALVLGLMMAVSSAVFLILELDRPFAGLIQISSGPLRNALEMLGR